MTKCLFESLGENREYEDLLWEEILADVRRTFKEFESSVTPFSSKRNYIRSENESFINKRQPKLPVKFQHWPPIPMLYKQRTGPLESIWGTHSESHIPIGVRRPEYLITSEFDKPMISSMKSNKRARKTSGSWNNLPKYRHERYEKKLCRWLFESEGSDNSSENISSRYGRQNSKNTNGMGAKQVKTRFPIYPPGLGIRGRAKYWNFEPYSRYNQEDDPFVPVIPSPKTEESKNTSLSHKEQNDDISSYLMLSNPKYETDSPKDDSHMLAEMELGSLGCSIDFVESLPSKVQYIPMTSRRTRGFTGFKRKEMEIIRKWSIGYVSSDEEDKSEGSSIISLSSDEVKEINRVPLTPVTSKEDRKTSVVSGSKENQMVQSETFSRAIQDVHNSSHSEKRLVLYNGSMLRNLSQINLPYPTPYRLSINQELPIISFAQVREAALAMKEESESQSLRNQLARQWADRFIQSLRSYTVEVRMLTHMSIQYTHPNKGPYFYIYLKNKNLTTPIDFEGYPSDSILARTQIENKEENPSKLTEYLETVFASQYHRPYIKNILQHINIHEPQYFKSENNSIIISKLIQSIHDIVENIEKSRYSNLRFLADTDAVGIMRIELDHHLNKLWDELKIAEIESDKLHEAHSNLAMMNFDMGQNLIFRVFNYLSTDQKLTLMTMLVTQIGVPDFVENGIDKNSVDAEYQIKYSAYSLYKKVMPTFTYLVSQCSFGFTVELLDMVIEICDIPLIVSTNIGLAALLTIINRIHSAGQNHESKSKEEEDKFVEDFKSWKTLFNKFFGIIQTAHFTCVFKSCSTSANSNYNAWKFLSTLGSIGMPHHQRFILNHVRETIFNTLDLLGDQHGEENLSAQRVSHSLNNINLFLNVLGLEASTKEITILKSRS